MITVKGRELIIPLPERQIGTDYDDQAEVRRFRINRFNPGGIDLSHLDFRVDLRYAGDVYDSCLLGKEVDEESITLTWQIPHACVSRKGTVWVSVRGRDINGTVRWATNEGALYVEAAVNTPEHFGGLSELEQLEILVEQAVTACNGAVESAEKMQQAAAGAVSRADAVLEETQGMAEEAMQAASDAIQQAVVQADRAEDESEQAEAWAHGHANYPENDEDNSKFWSRKAQQEYNRAKNEADRAAMYVDFVTPHFLIWHNRICINQNSTAEFLVDGNRLYMKLTA